jgi:hypothetical protein
MIKRLHRSMLYVHMIRHLLKDSYTVSFVDLLFVEFCCKYNNDSDLNINSINIVRNVIIQGVPLATEPGWLADRCSVSQQSGALQTHTTDTLLFISHTTNVLLFKFRCNIFIGVRIIQEMPSSVASGTPATKIYPINETVGTLTC